MHGPEILARFLQVPGPPDKYGNRWQYNSRSDRHSKVGCWGVALDLLATSSTLRGHVSEGKVVLGVNHTMTDFATGRKKDLDLVIARPSGEIADGAPTFRGLAQRYGMVLTDLELGMLNALPDLYVADVGAVLVALEAKACMTAHIKALPRLYDELNSSHLCVHGASRAALAIGYVQVNSATSFVSSVTNNYSLTDYPTRETKHRQPEDTRRVVQKVKEIPRRSASSEVGFDGVGITVIDFHNDGGPVEIVDQPPAPQPGDSFHYGSMIVRMANEYDTTFRGI
ncbi:MAG: hypothetical protein H0T14_01350 [Nocardioidaceae bacterium]|nr:hypothetical protein [Nocardioidaceae bacterium]